MKRYDVEVRIIMGNCYDIDDARDDLMADPLQFIEGAEFEIIDEYENEKE
jgi:hypothetical protein